MACLLRLLGRCGNFSNFAIGVANAFQKRMNMRRKSITSKYSIPFVRKISTYEKAPMLNLLICRVYALFSELPYIPLYGPAALARRGFGHIACLQAFSFPLLRHAPSWHQYRLSRSCSKGTR